MTDKPKPDFGAPGSFTNIAFDTGVIWERERIIARIERNICFDALADPDGRCIHHGGKCYDLRQLINSLKKGN
jgi:hypothetical protein